jgi:hypothetical protein
MGHKNIQHTVRYTELASDRIFGGINVGYCRHLVGALRGAGDSRFGHNALGRTDIGGRTLKESDLPIGIMRTQSRKDALSDGAALVSAQSFAHIWPSHPGELLLPRFDQKSIMRLPSAAFLLWTQTI